MSWINGLLIGAGEGLRRGGARYFEERDRRAQRELQEHERLDRSSEMVRRAMQDADEFSERKRANKANEQLNRDELVGRGMDRMLSRENARYTSDEATRRAIETALIRAESASGLQGARAASAERIAGMPARTSVRPPRQQQGNPRGPGEPPPNFDDPSDGLTSTQRDGIMWLNEPIKGAERAEREEAWKAAREAFPDANPGDVAAAAKRYLERLRRDRYTR